MKRNSVYYYADLLQGEERRIYDEMLQGMLTRRDVISVTAEDIEMIRRAISMVRADHPEIFWCNGAWESSSVGSRHEIRMEYTFSRLQIAVRQEQIERTVRRFFARLRQTDEEYDRIRKAYEFLVDTAEYVPGSRDNQNICSARVYGRTVCAGYARSYQYLLQRMGIQAIYVTGISLNEEGWGAHGWNIVRCNGRYYHVDVTHAGFGRGEKGLGKRGCYHYEYLCLDDRQMGVNHCASGELPLPSCCSRDLNYFVRSGLSGASFDAQAQESMRWAIHHKTVWMYQFTTDKGFRECRNAIEEGVYGQIARKLLPPSQKFTVWSTATPSQRTVFCWCA